MGTTQPSIQWITGASAVGGQGGRTTHLHLVLRMRVNDANPPLPHTLASFTKTTLPLVYVYQMSILILERDLLHRQYIQGVQG